MSGSGAIIQQHCVQTLRVMSAIVRPNLPPVLVPTPPELPYPPQTYPVWGNADVAGALEADPEWVKIAAWKVYEAAIDWERYWNANGYPDDTYKDVAAMIGYLATFRVEVGAAFRPIREYGGYDYCERNYGYQTPVGKTLGNTEPGDGYRFRGGGWIQRTGKGGFKAEQESLAQRLGIRVDLVGNPDAILEPRISALVAVNYCVIRALEVKARLGYGATRQGWVDYRRGVNGGTNGLADFLRYVERLTALSTDPFR